MMHYDVIVCGGGTSGMNAAIAAKRNGAKTLIVEASGLLGGTNVISLVSPFMTFHDGKRQVVQGIADEIIQRLRKQNLSFGHIKDPIAFTSSITPFDVEGLKQIYFDLVVEENIDVLFHSFIYNVIKEDNVLKGIEVVNKSGKMQLFADVIIDATGDGDVCALAGADFVMGREKDNKAQPMTMLFTMGNVNFAEIIAYMKDNKADFVIAADYDYEYLGVSGFFSKVKEAMEKNEFDLSRDRVLFFEDIQKEQVTINMTRVLNLSAVDALDLSKAEVEGRIQIKKAVKFLKDYIPGFKDAYIVRTPNAIGKRESRHIIGDYVLNEEDLLQKREFLDSIALGAFPIDIHSPDGKTILEHITSPNNAYEVPYRILLPKGLENILVTGRCVSSTHEANASLRVGPSVMALGQAVGTAAALAVREKTSPRSLRIDLLQETLKSQGQVFKKYE